MDYILHLLILITIYSILVITMNILLGYLGILYLGHPAIYGIGAYSFALLTTKEILSFFPALLAAGLIAMLAGSILALPALRLKSHYIGMTTYGFLVIVNGLMINLGDLTRGPLGVPGIPRPIIFGHLISTNTEFLIFTSILAIIINFILWRIMGSPFSKVVEAIREDETAVKTLGKNVMKYKIQAFMITAFFGGIGGALLASYLQYISPGNFATEELIIILAMTIIGGMASFWGSIVGAIVIILLPEPLRFLNFSAEIIGALRYGIYGLLIILFMIYKPNGILGKRTNIFSK
ncbi:branched-chain amino acid ABC transporter permease [Candidatus Peregrinibacteria bacterium]|nr:branched-chain amino acid ABC transporter permease [Candidatus Peregrinibacteria bacterium]